MSSALCWPAGVGAGGVPAPVLGLDAALHAVATGAYELHDHLDYTPWLRSSLLPVSVTLIVFAFDQFSGLVW